MTEVELLEKAQEQMKLALSAKFGATTYLMAAQTYAMMASAVSAKRMADMKEEEFRLTTGYFVSDRKGETAI